MRRSDWDFRRVPQRHTWVHYYHPYSREHRWLGWDGHRYHLLHVEKLPPTTTADGSDGGQIGSPPHQGRTEAE